MATPKYTLVYYDIRGRAEEIRYLFALAGVSYEDKRFPFDITHQTIDPDWAAIKNDTDQTPFGLGPVLWDNDLEQPIPGSQVIGRYLSRKFGFAGKSQRQELQIEGVCDYISDIVQEYAMVWMSGDPTKQTKWKAETLPLMLEKLEAYTKKHGSGWLIGDTVTYADCRLHTSYTFLTIDLSHPAYDRAPTIRQLIQKFEQLPAIAGWIAKRKKTFL